MMDTLKELPIFCDNCPTLAFAILDGAPLCEACLMKAVKNNTNLHIEPLQFKAPQMHHGCNTFCLECASH